ncbi:DUF6157 family protein [Paenibacillus pasadenensis]|uniref:DUF6157 family protein n=1 Tax=Paenibacillus pasadenensis TaxID=217090 RepID=UPI002041A9EC|nr:DUF6157 family protein [Paenibacillus pasadenensis]MCM3749762.1 DUF6157 family protein [Paenibacillus pasadenensis]
MDWNYYDTFIRVAADCPAEFGTVPPDKKEGKTKAGIEYELLASEPYRYTQEELLYEVHIRHQKIAQEEMETRAADIRTEFFSKPKPCLRASMLPKKFGWGLHFDHDGKIALVPKESEAYSQFLEQPPTGLKVLAAMRNRRSKS